MNTVQWKDTQNQVVQNDSNAFREINNVIDNPFGSRVYSSSYMSPQEYYANKHQEEMFGMFQDSMTQHQKYLQDLEKRVSDNHNSTLNMMSGFLDRHESLMTMLNEKYPTSFTDQSSTNSTGSNTNIKGSGTKFQNAMYSRLTELGYSNNQAIALMMQVAAEGSWADSHVFTKRKTNKIYSETDPSKNIAIGMINWQGGREVELYKNLGSKGLLNSDGTLVHSEDTIRVMTDYMDKELKSGKYSVSNFLQNKDEDPFKLARDLNLNYTKSNRAPKILEGREKNYRAFYNSWTKNGINTAPVSPENSTSSSGSLVIGDSIADGIKQQNKGFGNLYTKVGANTGQILNEVKKLKPEQIKGRTIVLSSGLMNSTLNDKSFNDIKNQIDYLRKNGANVQLLGVSNQWDKDGIGNKRLEEIAKQLGISFVGGYNSDTEDKVHRKSYKWSNNKWQN